MEVLTEFPVTVNPTPILSRFRVDEGTQDEANVLALVDRATKAMKPKALYDVCYIDDRGEDFVTMADVTFTSRVLAVNLKDAHRVFPYIVTCGTELDDLPLVTDDPMEPYWLDGSAPGEPDATGFDDN